MTAILLSVRPVYARAILAGTKTAEVRRRFPDQPVGAEVFVYSSTPDRSVLGTVCLEGIDRPDAVDVWDLYRGQIKIEREPLNDYLTAVRNAAILRVGKPDVWERPVSLAELRRRVGVEPPQSFRYLDTAQTRTLRALGRTRRVSEVTVAPRLVAFGWM